ncbi:MAG: undecaprenyl-phosphate glucose phosphotransferase [Lachnospiraceae bacterium]|nr:undecaprenyl-phosphate glucose phosphotransferase [Lachnospiraceae bacterium]
MIKDNQRYISVIKLTVDIVATVLIYVLSWFLKFRGIFMTEDPNVIALPMSVYMTALYFIVPGYTLLYYFSGLYSQKKEHSRGHYFLSIIWANTIGLALFIIVLYAVKQIHFSRSMIFIFYVLNIIILTVIHAFGNKIIASMVMKSPNRREILLVGYSRAAEGYISRIDASPEWGYVVRGILDDHVPAGTLYKGVKVLGTIANLQYILPENHLDEIAVTLSLQDYPRLDSIVSMCEKSGIHTKFIPDYGSLFPSNPYTEDLMGLPVISIRYVPLTNAFNALVKRVFDIVFSLLAIILTSPVMLVAAIAVRHSGPGGIIFKQERIGLHNKPFMMYKFRTMKVVSEEVEKKGWTTRDDPRVTRAGRFMRRTSIDELPQFFNVLKGEMSVVGPRPERPQFVDRFKEEIPRYMVKHQVRPGLTGWAQINGYRGDTSIKRRIEYDIYYIENWTFSLDLRIIFLTVFKVFRDKNAY